MLLDHGLSESFLSGREMPRRLVNFGSRTEVEGRVIIGRFFCTSSCVGKGGTSVSVVWPRFGGRRTEFLICAVSNAFPVLSDVFLADSAVNLFVDRSGGLATEIWSVDHVLRGNFGVAIEM